MIFTSPPFDTVNDMVANGRNLIFDLASRRVSKYAGTIDRGLPAVNEAAECEQSLVDGLDAIGWIRRADETMRAGDYEGIFDYSEELQAALKKLLDDWLQKATSVSTSAETLAARGVDLPHLNLFRERLAEVEEQVASGELMGPLHSPVFQDEPW